MSIRLLLADDQELVRTGLRLLVTTHPDVEVVGEAGDGVTAVAASGALRPDVILMDVRMPGMDGIEATARIVAAGTVPVPRVIILTTFDLDEYVFGALRAGASGFLLKDATGELLLDAIRTVHHGDALIAPPITRRLIEHVVARTAPPARAADLSGLTPREREILLHVARGLSNAEIAARLVISDATVKSHVGSLLSKLDLRDRVQAVVFAYEHGIVVAGDRAAG